MAREMLLSSTHFPLGVRRPINPTLPHSPPGGLGISAGWWPSWVGACGLGPASVSLQLGSCAWAALVWS